MANLAILIKWVNLTHFDSFGPYDSNEQNSNIFWPILWSKLSKPNQISIKYNQIWHDSSLGTYEPTKMNSAIGELYSPMNQVYQGLNTSQNSYGMVTSPYLSPKLVFKTTMKNV